MTPNTPRPVTLTIARRVRGLVSTAALAAVWNVVPSLAWSDQAEQVSRLLDISGVAWVEDDVFVAVHDGKSDAEEGGRARVSLLLLPADAVAPPQFARQAPDGVYYQDLAVVWPSATPNDLESIARIPGSRQFLLVESGDDCGPFQRIFLTSLSSSWQLTVDEVVPWPVSPSSGCSGVFNVEGSAVFRVGGQLYFVYAERAEGQPDTRLRWAKMHLNPLRFEEFSSARYAARMRGTGVRPIVALDVDEAGVVYAATAYDSGEDNGPFRSTVSRIGRFRAGSHGNAHFVPMEGLGQVVARQDGFKIEGVALRPRDDGKVEVFAGTDDENYGAVFRQVAPVR